jgi:hypothetical protein
MIYVANEDWVREIAKMKLIESCERLQPIEAVIHQQALLVEVY